MPFLHVVTCLANPLAGENRVNNAKRAILNWMKNPDVHVYVVECVYPWQQKFALENLVEDYSDRYRYHHIPVQSNSWCWNQRNLFNLGISKTPSDAEFVATFDADVTYADGDDTWAQRIMSTLRQCDVIQPWSGVSDHDPDGQVIKTRESFMLGHHLSKQVQGMHGHTGFAWAYRREFVQSMMGLFETEPVGGADKIMAYCLVGRSAEAIRPDLHAHFKELVSTWSTRAFFNQVVTGWCSGHLQHMWHGERSNRQYHDRWQMLKDSQFDPYALKRNTSGVIEIVGRPDLERQLQLYMESRHEDAHEREPQVA